MNKIQVSSGLFSSMTVGSKFALTCTALVLFSVALAVVSLYNINTAADSVQVYTRDVIPGVANIEAIESDVMEYRGNCWKHIASSDANLMAGVERDNQRILGEIQEGIRGYESGIVDEDDRREFSKFRPALDRYVQAWEAVLPVSRAGRNEEAATKYMATVDPQFRPLHAVLTDRTKWNRDYADRTGVAATERASRGRAITWLLAISAIGLGIVVAVLLVRSVNRALKSAVASVASAATQMAAASAQIASSSQSLAQGSSEQAASLEETSASTQEISSMTQRNRESARTAAEVVTQSERRFNETNQSLDDMVAAMADVTASSGKISKIIKVIDEIAFQTNILALNAAVEAARAGEAGMGFAVVADEVRSLAQRCAEAARETSGLIEESIAKSGAGKAKVDQVANDIHAITAESARVKTLVDEVNQGSDEQAKGLNEISRAMSQMERITQMTAASAEESASASEELTAQASALKEVVEELTMLVGE